jgi:4-hydroxythreonine-4-phosphate dehydrogenase
VRIIGITLGDRAGIGPEVIRAALDSGRLDPGFSYEIIGDDAKGKAGEPDEKSARAAFADLEKAAAMGMANELEAIVTGPIHKYRMRQIGFDFPGQTEFFADRCGVTNFAMLLTGGALTVALVTTHIPLSQVAPSLRRDEIVRVGLLLADFLRCRNSRPSRIAVAGLNPHAGESGAVGREEIEIIAPAIVELREKKSGDIFEGPIPPDTLFYHVVRGDWDAALCMYHDQALIPLKLHAFEVGVNVTLGLPFIRTSPDHGTAFDIAGKGIANPESMVNAINLAAELARKKNG